MSGRVDIDFIAKDTLRSDVELFLGPVSEDQEQIIFDPKRSIMAHLIKETEVFPSVSQARKNGWNKPIPEGFSQFEVGKQKALVTILNIKDS